METEHSGQSHPLGRHQAVHFYSEAYLDSRENVALILKNT